MYFLKDFIATLDLNQCRTVLLNLFSNRGGIQMVQAALQGDSPTDRPPQQPDNLPWCICSKCRPMQMLNENVCCRHRHCISDTELFESTVLDLNVLNVAILNRSEVFVESPDYSPSSY